MVTMADIAVHRRGLQKEEGISLACTMCGHLIYVLSAPLKRLAIELGLPYYLTEKGATELKKLHFKVNNT